MPAAGVLERAAAVVTAAGADRRGLLQARLSQARLLEARLLLGRLLLACLLGVRLLRAGLSGGQRPQRRLGGPRGDGWDLDVLLGMVAPARRPWLQRTVRAGRAAVGRWLAGLPERAAGWGAGPDRAWCAW